MSHTYKTWLPDEGHDETDAIETTADSPGEAAKSRALDEFDSEGPEIGTAMKYEVMVEYADEGPAGSPMRYVIQCHAPETVATVVVAP